MTELEFSTVQAAADYGRPESVLRAMMEALRPDAKTFVFVGVGSVQAPRAMGLPQVVGGYHTVSFGHVDVIGCSALVVGGYHTDANGVTWEVMANTTRQGSASWLGSHVFCAVEVTQ